MSSVSHSSDVDIIMYAMVFTRPNISHAISVVSKYMTCHEMSIGEMDYKIFIGNWRCGFDI